MPMWLHWTILLSLGVVGGILLGRAILRRVKN